MLTYSRWTPPHALAEVESHVRAHLSSVATEDDDPVALSADVVITRTEQDDGILVTGELDAEPVADYLRDGWTPEQDIENNPLSVPSIEDEL